MATSTNSRALIVTIKASGSDPFAYPAEIAVVDLEGALAWSTLISPVSYWRDRDADATTPNSLGFTIEQLDREGLPAERAARRFWDLAAHTPLFSETPRQDSIWLDYLSHAARPPLRPLRINPINVLIGVGASRAYFEQHNGDRRAHRALPDALALRDWILAHRLPRRGRPLIRREHLAAPVRLIETLRRTRKVWRPHLGDCLTPRYAALMLNGASEIINNRLVLVLAFERDEDSEQMQFELEVELKWIADTRLFPDYRPLTERVLYQRLCIRWLMGSAQYDVSARIRMWSENNVRNARSTAEVIRRIYAFYRGALPMISKGQHVKEMIDRVLGYPD